MTAIAVEAGKLDIGRVIQQTFAVIGRNAATFFVLAFVLSGVPMAILAMFQAASLQDGVAGFNPAALGTIFLGALVAIITNAVLQGTLIYGTVQDLNGGKASIGDSIARGLSAFLPLLGVTIVFVLAVFFGSMLLLVPGIMIAIAWCVCVPAVVAERKGVFGSISRAAELTRGNRWRIFGLVVVVYLILMVIGLVFAAISGGASVIARDEETIAALSPVNIAVSVISNTITGVLASAGLAVLYVELRRLKEGTGSEWLSEVFA